MIKEIKRSISKALPRMVTDIVRYLLRCFLEDVQEANLLHRFFQEFRWRIPTRFVKTLFLISRVFKWGMC